MINFRINMVLPEGSILRKEEVLALSERWCILRRATQPGWLIVWEWRVSYLDE